MRLEDELGRIRAVKKWETAERGTVYYDKERKRHLSTTRLGAQMAEDYERRTALTNELRQLKAYWLENTGKPFSRKTFSYKPKTKRNRLELLFGAYADMKEEPNTHENKVHHEEDGRDYDSKTEMDLGNVLKALHIDYKIHVTLVFPGGEKIVADFVIFLPEIGRYVIIEHCGRINLGYYNDTLSYKERTFLKYNLIPHRDLFYTYEDRESPATFEYFLAIVKAFIITIV